VRDHSKAVDALEELNDYCENGNCEKCTFAILRDCPFYIIPKENFDLLREEARRLTENEETRD